MALKLDGVAATLVFALGLLNILQLSTCQTLKGRLSCLDCTSPNYDFSGIMVGVRCDGVRKMSRGIVEQNGAFKVEVPSGSVSVSEGSSSTTKALKKKKKELNCMVKIVGGPNQLYASNQDMTSRMIQSDRQPYVITTSTPLAFYTTRPTARGVVSSKTVDLPLPKEWGLAPSSLYFPFFPIIGIP